MAEEHRKNTKAKLALALAHGVTAAKWARSNDVTKMTAYRWAKEPLVRKAVESYRRRLIDHAIGLMAKQSTPAANTIVRISKEAESDSVRLRAARAIFSDVMTVSKYAGWEVRLAELEKAREQPQSQPVYPDSATP
jgi:hypothetical protein